jgi:ankyrin repeat protein
MSVRCKLCKSEGTNASTCPLNYNARNKDFLNHYLVKQNGGGIQMGGDDEDLQQEALRVCVYGSTYDEFVKAMQNVSPEQIEDWNLLPLMIYHTWNQRKPDPVEKTQFLLSKGANPNHYDKNGYLPLTEAAHAGFTETVTALVNAGADIDRIDKFSYYSPQTALMAATTGNGYPATIKRLIELGADKNVKVNNQTANTYAKKNLHRSKELLNALGE